MSIQMRQEKGALHQRWDRRTLIILFVATLFIVIGLSASGLISPARAAAGDVTIAANAPEFRFIINEDIAHDNPSTTPPRSYSPVVEKGIIGAQIENRTR